MVSRVNLGTNRDTGAESYRPTVAAINIRVLLASLERLGFAVDALLAAAGLTPSHLDNPDARLPVRAYLAIIGQAQRERPDIKNLALHVAAATPLGAYPLTDYLVVTSDTLAHGFKQLAKYFSTAGAPVSLDLDAGSDPIRVVVRSPFSPFGAEYVVALHFFHSQREVDGPFHASEIAFQHHPGDVEEWRRVFKCPVVGGSSWSGMALARQVWQLPFRRRDSALRAVLEHHVADVAARLPMQNDVAMSVRQALTWRLLSGEATGIEDVARHLGTGPRTLQRRLADAGLAYRKIRDEVRRVSAEHHLSGSPLSIGEVAYLVGYRDRRTLNRAFLRWTGMTPQRFREQD